MKKTINPKQYGQGWHTISNTEHHSIDAITSTSLKLFEVSPYRYYHQYILQDMPIQSYRPSFKIGTGVHMLLLEPELASTNLLVCDFTSTSKKYSDFLAANIPDYQSAHDENGNGRYVGKGGEFWYVYNTDEYQQIKAMAESATQHKYYQRLRELAVPEITGLAHISSTEEWVSCRGDLRGKTKSGNGYFVDIKTIESISEKDITNHVFSYGYILQQVHYLNVSNLIEPNTYKNFYFYFIEKQYPHECALLTIELSDEEQKLLDDYYENLLASLIMTREDKTFTTLDKQKNFNLKIPSWYFNKLKYSS